jgi:hypothetical protein
VHIISKTVSNKHFYLNDIYFPHTCCPTLNTGLGWEGGHSALSGSWQHWEVLPKRHGLQNNAVCAELLDLTKCGAVNVLRISKCVAKKGK